MGRIRLETRSMPAVALFLCFGAGVAANSASIPLVIIAGLVALNLVGVLVALWQTRRRMVTLAPLWITLTIGSATVLAGFLRHEVSIRTEPDDIRFMLTEAPVDVLLDGRIVAEPTWRDGRVRFPLDARTVSVNGDVRPASGRIMVNRDADDRDAFFAGLDVRIAGTLAPPFRARNPADFDYAAFLSRQNIHATLRSSASATLEADESRTSALDLILRSIRRHIRDAIDRHVPSPESRTVVQALTLGDRSGLSSADRERFARTGLMHLLAVSGLHVLLVGMVFYRVLRPSLVRMRLGWHAVEVVRSAATLILLLTYMMVTGNSPSVVRAVVMTSLFIFGTLLQRRGHSLNTLAVAGLVLLAARPSDLFQPGFQLSFSAVSAIILFSPAIPSGARGRHLNPVVRYAAQSAAVSLAATLGTLPALLYHFGRSSFAGLALNLAAIPATAGLLSSSLAMIVTAGIPGVGSAFGSSADVLARGLMAMAGIGDEWFRFALVERYVRDAWLLGALGGLAAMPSVWQSRTWRWRYVVVLAGLTSIAWWSSTVSRDGRSLEILFFDVGQADATLIRFPNGRTLLVDAGRRDFGFDAGERVILPHLRRFGVRNLDGVVITHPHNDHLGGLPFLLQNTPIRRVLDNGDDYDSDVFRETIHLLDAHRIPRQTLRSGDTLLIDPRVRVLVLGPDEGTGHGVNDRSVVLQIHYGRTRILLTGDAEEAAEHVLTASFSGLLSSDLVKAGHHGSSTSSTPAFVSNVTSGERGVRTVISVGAVNRYRHPNPDIIARWRAHGSEVHKTSLTGAVWFRSDGSSVREVEWRR